MSVEIVPVNSGKREKLFIDFPWTLYHDDPHWVPPLKISVKEILSPKHPFNKRARVKKWLALEKGVVVGRIASIINDTHNEFHNEKTGFFGWFDCVENHDVAQALIHRVEQDCLKEKMSHLRGPANPSTNYECGLLVDGFNDSPQIMMTYNKRYYESLLLHSGLKKCMDLFAYKLPHNVTIPEALSKATERAKKSKRITVRKISKKNWEKEISTMLEIYNDAWEKNWGFVPMSEEEFRHMGDEMKMIADEDFILIVEVGGNPAGFIVGLPDFNQIFKRIPSGKLFPFGIFKLLSGKRRIQRLRIITLGVKARYRQLGLASILITEVQKNLIQRKQFSEIEQSWVLENNEAMNRPMELLQADLYKKYRLFEKRL